MEIPDGFYYKDSDSNNTFVLCLERNLCGLKQASYNWSELLKAGLIAQGLKQNDTIFYSSSDDAIDKEISSLKAAGLDLNDEGDVNAFL
eukprot:15235494-Ditylum_brightwellii.AAC.1